MDLETLFDIFKNSAFRLEGLPTYRVHEEREAVAQFEDTGTLPEGFNDDWAELVSAATASGKSMNRLRLVSSPLSAYEQLEMIGYQPGLRAGEQIRLLERDGVPFRQDFWVFDDRWIARMNYAPDGSWISADVRELTPADFDEVEYWKSLFATATLLLSK